MNTITEEFTITLKYHVIVDTETGEMTTKCIKRTIDKSNFEVADSPKRSTKKSKKEESSTPQVILEDNKLCFNSAAVSLMNIEAGNKIDIKYEEQNKVIRPIIATDEVFGTKGGNMFTKSNTLACRGSKHNELVKYGNIFEVVPHESKDGFFVLVGNITQKEVSGDENLILNESDDELPLDVDLNSLIEDQDADITEINSDFFKL